MPHGNTEAQSMTRTGHHMKILDWNVEGLKTVVNNIQEDIFNQFAACTLTEMFTLDISKVNVLGFYNIHTLARQGERGRPVGGVSCLIKPGLAPFRIMLNDED
jgi:hypothetical protein